MPHGTPRRSAYAIWVSTAAAHARPIRLSGGSRRSSVGIRYSNIVPLQDRSVVTPSTRENGRPSWSQCFWGTSPLAMARKLAIAKGDVPQKHWLQLGRPFSRVEGVTTLLSWSGTMFEYLMPTLLLREPPESLMGRACAAAVETQIAYADRRGVPWGMSESGYYRVDAQRSYQYRAFGVPD